MRVIIIKGYFVLESRFKTLKQLKNSINSNSQRTGSAGRSRPAAGLLQAKWSLLQAKCRPAANLQQACSLFDFEALLLARANRDYNSCVWWMSSKITTSPHSDSVGLWPFWSIYNLYNSIGPREWRVNQSKNQRINTFNRPQIFSLAVLAWDHGALGPAERFLFLALERVDVPYFPG